MRRVFENGHSPADFAYAFAHVCLNRCAFFNARRKVMRVARKTDGLLAGDQELYQIRMSAMKLNLISSDLLEQLDGLLVAVVLSLSERDQNLIIPIFAHEIFLPFRVPEILKVLGFFALLN